MATVAVLTKPSSSHAKAQVIDLTLDDDDAPPRKRQRTEQPTITSPETSSSTTQTPTLDSLSTTLHPRIERALERLPDGVYDKAALGMAVLERLVRDGSFVASGKATGWHFSPERDQMISTKISAILGQTRNQFILPPQHMRPPRSGRSQVSSPDTPISPSKLVYRPVATRTPSGGSASNSPVPLPAYAQNRKQSSPLLVQESPVPFPAQVLQRMMQGATTSGRNESGTGQTRVKSEVSTPTRSPAMSMRATEMPKKTGGTRPNALPQRQHTVTKPIIQTKIDVQKFSRRPGLSTASVTPEAKEVPPRRSSSTVISSTPVPLPATATQSARPWLETSNSKQSKAKARTSSTNSPVKSSAAEKRKPFLRAKERRAIADCVGNKRSKTPGQLVSSTIFHVDLTDQELDVIKFSLQSLVSKPLSLQSIRYHPQRTGLATFLSGKLDGRTVSDIHNFLEDLPDFEEERSQHQLSLVRDDFLAQQRRRDRRLNALRLDREMNGRFAVGAPMTQRNLQTEALKDLSDSMGHTVARFGQCSGDVATMAWVSDRSILCGATSTMDDRTLDHNKQGNLVLYSAATEKLEVFKDHREPRPTREGENRDFSRDKWLYPSVVASTIDPARHLVYTAAFDKTVKVWNTKGNAGSSMDVVGTWPHEGKVNFVAAAQNGSGLVATAADVSPEAVRVYAINMQDPSASQYISLSCPRRDDQGSDEWAYWPATLQWGTAEGTRHLLAVGYSPRSRDGDENQIPEDKQRTGAILLWDSQTGRVIPVHANTVANVFEVVWHPTLPQLIVATSRSGLHVEKGVRTQIRIWKQDPDRMETDQGWHEYKTLDCTAEDINELTVMPNSSHHTYITASCTSGEIFVWDTARGDRPIHVLRHGPSIEPFESEEDMKRRDVGVKFTAWGHTPDRLFTGSSDGKVNLWNVRKKDPFIRTVMQGEGAIFCGAFSPDKKILAIGDGPGTVWLLTDPDEHPESWGKVCKKRHIPHVPDVEDTNETSMDDVDDDNYPRQRYLDTQELVYTGIPVVGVVQGPIYQQGIHFDLKSHLNEDKTGPLIPTVERQQQAALRATQRRRRSMRRLRPTAEHSGQAVKLHKENSKKDFDPSKLGKRELEELKRDRVELEASDEDLVYESE